MNPQPIRVLIVDNRNLSRNGIKARLLNFAERTVKSTSKTSSGSSA